MIIATAQLVLIVRVIYDQINVLNAKKLYIGY